MNNSIKELEVEKFEHLAKYFDDSIEVLNNTNSMIEKEISLLEESGKIVDEALYNRQIANEAHNLDFLKWKLETLTTQMANSLSSGAIEKGSEEWQTMNDAINETNEAIVDTKLNIEQLNNEITQLEVDKFKRIEEHFDAVNNVFDNSNNSLQQYIELLEKSGHVIDDSMYVPQIKNEKDKIAFLEQAKIELEEQLAASVNSGKVEKNSDEWKEMNEDIMEIDSSIMDARINIEDLKDSITQLEVDKFERMSGHFDELKGVLDDSNNSIKQNIDLLEESGEVIDDSMYLAQIENEKDKIALLQQQKDALEEQLKLSVQTGYIEENSDEWKEMKNTISEIDDTILDTQINIEELNNAITQLEVDKFNRMNDHFGELISVLDDSNSTIKQNIDLLEESGQVIDDSMYVAQIENEEQKLSLLQQQKDALEKQLELSVQTGYIEENSEEWKEMSDTIAEIDEAILDSRISIEELNNAITQLEVDKFDRIADYFSKVTGVIDDSNSTIQKQISLLEESGDIIHESLYQAQIQNEEDKIAFLKAEKEQLEIQLADSMSSGYIEKGSEEWHSMTDKIDEVSNAILDSQINIEEFNNTIKELEVQKFERISEHFQSLSDVLDNSNNLIQKQIGLLEESGKIVGKSYYTAQIDNEQQRLELLEQQKDALTKQMNESVSKGLIEEGSEEWLSMIESINETDSSILDCKTSIEELDNAILDLEWQTFERIQESFNNLNSELENLLGLFDEADIADENGIWTKEAIAQLGLLAQQYELAVYQSEQYKKRD